MNDTAVATAIATVLSAAIAGVVGLVTHRSAARSAERNQTTISRTDIEKEAFDRASGLLSAQFERQEREIERQDREITELHHEVGQLRTEVRELREANEKQADTIARRDAEIRTLAAQIAARGEG